jgi:hypothetical protein
VPDLSAFINFSVKFDLTSGTPVITLEDTSSYPGGVPAGITGFFSVTQPDGGTDAGSWTSLDVTWNGSALTTKDVVLRMASDGNPQNGSYTIVYNATHASYAPTTLSRTFTFNFTTPELELTEDFDVFTPDLKYTDDTDYSVSGYNAPTLTRSWSVTSTPTGAITASTQTVDLAFGGDYYDALYTVVFSVTALYQHATYAYLTVEEFLTQTINTSADTPPGYSGLVEYLSDLKDSLDATDNTSYAYNELKKKYEYASSLLNHITNAGVSGNIDNLERYLNDFVLVTNNYTTPAYTNTNAVIPPYNFGVVAGGQDITPLYVVFPGPDSASYTNASLLNKTIIMAVSEGGVIKPADISLTGTTVTKVNPGDEFITGHWYLFLLKSI